MSMKFHGAWQDLTNCPECNSEKLEVAVYPDGKRFLECVGCYSVVCEVTGTYRRYFSDYAEQKFYEGLIEDGYTHKKAFKETKTRFKAYDEGKDIIFVK